MARWRCVPGRRCPLKTIAEHILDSYQTRPCWVCGAIGPCLPGVDR
jgi:hypothetical protein